MIRLLTASAFSLLLAACAGSGGSSYSPATGTAFNLTGTSGSLYVANMDPAVLQTA